MNYDKERYANDPVYRAKLNAASKAWSDANRPRINARRRHRRATDPKVAAACRDDWLWSTYGIRLAHFEAMVARQKGRCALCRRRPTERLCVDHSHDTEMLRLLLCRTCNTGFGCFRDDPTLMRTGADYLDIWRLIHAMMGRASAKRIRKKSSKPKQKSKQHDIKSRSARRQQGQPLDASGHLARTPLPAGPQRRSADRHAQAGRPQPRAKSGAGRRVGDQAGARPRRRQDRGGHVRKR